jgi:uncharacterized protein
MALEMTGERSLAIGKAELWRLLNDPEVLVKVIPGCNAVERVDEDRYRMGLKLQVANVSGEYLGEVEIRDKREPHHCVIAVCGEGSIGFMRGEAAIDLQERGGDESLLRFAAKAEVGGVVAGVGQRVLGGVAKFLVGRFFKLLELHIDQNGAGKKST